MRYFDCRKLLPPWVIILLLVNSDPIFSLQVRALQVISDRTGTFSGLLGFPRNFSAERAQAEPYSLTDTELSSFFCSTSQRLPYQQTRWPRLKATPGATICPHYALDTLTRDRVGQGTIRWYGSSYDNRTEYRKLSDIVNLPEDRMGQALAMHSYPSLDHSGCPTPFQIPKDLRTASVYTIYWLWNTTRVMETGYKIYTTCFDIEVTSLEELAEGSSPRGDTLSLTVTSTHFICPTRQASKEDRTTIGSPSSPSDVPNQASVFKPTESSRVPSITSISTSTLTSISRSTNDLLANVVSKITPSIPLTVAGKTSLTPTHSPPVLSAASTHTVKLIPGEVVTFKYKYLNVSVGDTVYFKSRNGSFFLFNTTFEDPCSPVRQIENQSQDSVLYTVQNADPVWLLACNSAKACRCYPPSHFALNPGVQSGQFFDGIKHKSVYISTTTAQPTRSTTTKVVVVTA